MELSITSGSFLTSCLVGFGIEDGFFSLVSSSLFHASASSHQSVDDNGTVGDGSSSIRVDTATVSSNF
jgi:hypothetical protein